MQINSLNSSPLSFGSIQIASSKMSRRQRQQSEQMYDIIKSTSKYADNEAGATDIYIMPAPNKGAGIELRFMDLYSGRFIRNPETGRPFAERFTLRATEDRDKEFRRMEAVADKAIQDYLDIEHGKVVLPKTDIKGLIAGKTEMSKLNPKKQKIIEKWKKEYENLLAQQKSKRYKVDIPLEEYIARHIDLSCSYAQPDDNF